MNFSDYYQAYDDYFWTWEEEANVIAVPGGSTIAYREQVSEILSSMTENGLPPFGSFLLAMIATNKTMDDGLQFVQSKLKNYLQQTDSANQYKQEILRDAFAFLNILQQVPQEYKTGKRRQLLLQTIFANSHNRLNSSTSRGIANGLKTNNNGRSRLMRLKPFSNTVFIKELRAIELLIRLFPTSQVIIDAMGELPALEEDELLLLEETNTTTTDYTDFVEELISNPQSFYAGALIKPIWAGFNIPIFNSHPSEQPLGGVSDLSNKGDFDKLLVSEFANDDMVFMNRIANNEALYLHREMPPVKDKLHRTILIDISLKNWGTPKILSFASYIAIARHPKALSESNAFAVGNQYIPIACSDIGQVIDALQKVDAGLHAGKGLAAFLADNKQQQLELFYITTPEALLYPEVQQQLAAHHHLFKYIITTDASGEINFYRRKNHTQRHLQTIRLPLEKLWANKPVNKSREVQTVSVPQPGNFIPLLVPTPQAIRHIIPLEEEDAVYCIADKCLFRQSIPSYKNGSSGWKLMLRNIVGNGYYELGKLENGQVHFLAFNPQDRSLCIYNLDTQQSAKTIFSEWKSRVYKEFLFNQHQQFIALASNPEAYQFEPDFITGNIRIEKIQLSSDVFGIGYPNRRAAIAKFMVPSSNTNILRNITDVYINQDRCIVLNGTYQLGVLHESQLFYNAYTINRVPLSNTERPGNQRDFIFKDGSKLSVDKSGYIKLTSSNKAIPEIYFTSILDRPLAAATADHFAGNDSYYDAGMGMVNVNFIAAGQYPLEAVKTIRQFSDIPLIQAKNIIDSSPQLIPVKMPLSDAKKMVDKLEKAGCTATIIAATQKKQTVININSFYRDNIATFIEHILPHATAG